MRSFYCTFIILVLSGLCFSQQVVKTADGQKVILNTDHTWTFADDSTQTGSAGTGSRPDAETAQSGSIQSLKETDGPAGPAALSIDALPGQYRSMMMVIGGVAVVLLIIISILLVYFLIANYSRYADRYRVPRVLTDSKVLTNSRLLSEYNSYISNTRI